MYFVSPGDIIEYNIRLLIWCLHIQYSVKIIIICFIGILKSLFCTALQEAGQVDWPAHVVSPKTMGLVLFFFVNEKWLCPSFPRLVMPECFLSGAVEACLTELVKGTQHRSIMGGTTISSLEGKRRDI